MDFKIDLLDGLVTLTYWQLRLDFKLITELILSLKLCNINLHSITHSLLSQNPT